MEINTSDKQYKIGIIGAGKIVENSHLPVLKNLGNVSVEWIYDTNANRTSLLSSMYDVQPVVDNKWEEAISKIDICVITIPYGVRIEYLKAAARLKKSVYVEKPFALSVKEHVEVSSMFKSHEIAIGFQRRCYKIADDLKQLIASGIFGSLKRIEYNQGYFTLKGGQGYLSDVKLSGGGVIIESAIHAFDQILNFTQSTNVEVEKVKYLQKNGIDYDSSVQSCLTTPFGKISVASQVSTLRNLNNGLGLSFDNATVKCKLSADAIISVYSHDDRQQIFTTEKDCNIFSYPKSINGSFFIFWKNFIKALDEKAQNLTSANSSLLTTEWMEKIYARINE